MVTTLDILYSVLCEFKQHVTQIIIFSDAASCPRSLSLPPLASGKQKGKRKKEEIGRKHVNDVT